MGSTAHNKAKGLPVPALTNDRLESGRCDVVISRWHRKAADVVASMEGFGNELFIGLSIVAATHLRAPGDPQAASGNLESCSPVEAV